MWPFNRQKSWVKFYSLIPNGELLTPILPTNKIKRTWLDTAKQKFKKEYKNSLTNNQYQIRSIHKCPGINELINRGVVLTAHRDFTFKIFDNNMPGSFDQPVGLRHWRNKENLTHDSAVLSSEIFSDFYNNPIGTSKHIVKITLPWMVECSDDLCLLVGPVPYSEENRFMCLSGILDPGINSTISAFLWWFNDSKKEDVIKEGTPLMHMMFINKKENIPWSMHEVNDDVLKRQKTKDYYTETHRVVNYENLKKKCPFHALFKK